jgi:hypothetical protein
MLKQFKKTHLKPLSFAITLTLTISACNNASTSETTVTPTNNEIKLTLDQTISLKQVTEDVTYLASNELNGRGNFSKDIKKAAQYIGKRFNQVGLTSPQGIINFQQYYNITTITPFSLLVVINGKTLATNTLTMASNIESFTWDNNTQGLTTDIINKDDDIRKILTAINKKGGKHLVLLHPSHEKTFKRYQSYFARGLTKLTTGQQNNTGGILVVALTDLSSITNLSVTGESKLNQTKISNVVGILPGKSKPDEIVLYSAHYDHLGGKASLSDDETSSDLLDNSNSHKNIGKHIFNGADDDASGVSAIINLANHFKKMGSHERTLMFSAFSAEEIGGFGSKYFATQINPANITAMINIEMIGKPAKFGQGTLWMTGMERSNLGEQLNVSLKEHGTEIYADPYPEQKLFYRSDNATLARLGVPAHSFSSTQLDKDKHYHQVSDDIDSLNLESMHQVIKTLAIATTPLVNGSITPNRIDPNLVKSKGLIF